MYKTPPKPPLGGNVLKRGFSPSPIKHKTETLITEKKNLIESLQAEKGLEFKLRSFRDLLRKSLSLSNHLDSASKRAYPSQATTLASIGDNESLFLQNLPKNIQILKSKIANYQSTLTQKNNEIDNLQSEVERLKNTHNLKFQIYLDLKEKKHEHQTITSHHNHHQDYNRYKLIEKENIEENEKINIPKKN